MRKDDLVSPSCEGAAAAGNSMMVCGLWGFSNRTVFTVQL